MDPDVARQELVELANKAKGLAERNSNRYPSPMESTELEDAVTELVEKVHDLDEWLRAGGFLPKAWAKRPDAQHGRHQEV